MLHIQIEGRDGLQQLASTRCIVGKDSECDLVLSGWKVSRRHAELFVSNERVYVRDLDSSFGTWLGEQRVGDTMPVPTGATLRIGGHNIRAHWARQDAEATAPVPAGSTPQAGAAAEIGRASCRERV